MEPKIAVGDAKYGTETNIIGLEERGIKAYLPTPDLSKRSEYYSSELFYYDVENDQYICPQEHILPLWSRRKREEKYVYRADAKVCDACPMKGECTGSKSGRHIFRSFHQVYIDKVKTYHETEAYKKAARKHSVWVEPLFGEAKDFHRLRRFRLRGLRKVNIEGMMIAAGQNLKRLIKHKMEKLCCFFAKFDFPNNIYSFHYFFNSLFAFTNYSISYNAANHNSKFVFLSPLYAMWLIHPDLHEHSFPNHKLFRTAN